MQAHRGVYAAALALYDRFLPLVLEQLSTGYVSFTVSSQMRASNQATRCLLLLFSVPDCTCVLFVRQSGSCFLCSCDAFVAACKDEALVLVAALHHCGVLLWS
jgi:hypothetical protein